MSVSLLCGFVLTGSARAEVLVRWDRDQVPSPDSLGVSTLVIPAKNKAAAQRALEQGYSVVFEVDAPALATFAPPAGRVSGVIVKGTATRAQLSQLRLRLKPRGITVRTLEERGKWPHIRSNWVTNENGVLQVSSRTQQPWIENNAALIKIAQIAQPDAVPLLTYPWTPITLSDIQEGPALENYLVAIAESGSFGADLVLPLHERFQERPAARPAAGARVVDGDAPHDRVLRVEPAEPLSGRRDDWRGDGRSDALVRGDEPAVASHASVRPDPAGQFRGRRAISRSSICSSSSIRRTRVRSAS